MRLSIIVPIYNMAADEKLTFCVNSLLNQELDDYEIILVDDCSTDNSYEIAKDYAARFPERISVYQTPYNNKQGAARNIGLKHAKGDWVGFIDSDDWAHPKMYADMLKKADETGADLVSCGCNLVSEHTFEVGQVIENTRQDQTGVLDDEKYRSLIMHSGSVVIKIYKTEVLKNNNLTFPEGMFYEDNAVASFWIMHFKHFEKVDEPYYYYYQHESSTVHHISEAKCRDRLKAGELMYDFFKEADLLDRFKPELEFRFTELYYTNTLFTYVRMNRAKLSFLREMKRGMKKRFPSFEENPYYQKTFDAEQKKLMHMHMKSSILFLLYYRSLTLFRRLFR